jgi:hypothetical protein
MATMVELRFCALPATPSGFDEEKFKTGDSVQVKLYKDSKRPDQSKLYSYEDLKIDEGGGPNYARFVPEGCCFIDFDNSYEAEEMKEIIIRSGVRCLILQTQHGYHFLFRTPDFYKKEMTGAINWFGYKFDTKQTKAVQILKVCGMERNEYCSWDPDVPVAPAELDIEKLDVLPYWLWGGKEGVRDLHKKGKTSTTKYTLDDTPFTKLMKLKEGSRHDFIFSRCGFFAVVNGFLLPEFKALIQAIHDQYLVKIGTPMTESDLFSDLDKRWDSYIEDTKSAGWDFDIDTRVWLKVEGVKPDKIDERRAAEYIYSLYDFYGTKMGSDGIFKGLCYKDIEGPYELRYDLSVLRGDLKKHTEQNIKETFFEEVENQVMQLCAENKKLIKRNDSYIIAKNKVLSCITGDAYDFSWLGDRPPTDVILRWNWQPREWVEEHEEDLGKQINWFISQLSRNIRGIPQPVVQDWLWVIAGASMIPANQLQKIVILAGGGQNGKSLYTSLIRLCLGEDMFNESKIFDSNPHDNKFWGEDLDKGILCVIDDLNRVYNRDAFSYIKGAITGTDTVYINEKFQPKKKLEVLPQIIACTNFDFELYDKSEGMKRRVLILPTEFHIDDSVKDGWLQHKLVLNTTDMTEIADYKMKESAFGDRGEKVMNMYTRESGVLDSLDHGSLCWFANKARYRYIDWVMGGMKVDVTEDMKERLFDTFSGGYEAEICDFLEWYVTERKEDIWTRELYAEYHDWHEEMATGEVVMKEKAFSMKLSKGIAKLNEKGYDVEMKKVRNEKGMSVNKLFIHTTK